MLFDHTREPADLHGVQRRSTSLGDGLDRALVEIWVRGKCEGRLEIRSTETVREFAVEPALRDDPFPDKLTDAGDVMLVNGSTLLAYFSEENVYDTLDAGEPDAARTLTRGALVEAVVTAEQFDVSEEGTEAVANRRSTRYSFRPNENAGPFVKRFGKCRIWVDGEYSVPLKIELEYRVAAGTLAETRAFESVEFDTVFDDSIFEFDPPDGASTTDVF